MTIFDGLTLIGGLCLFLFGMNLMGEYLEKSAGSGLNKLLGRLTTGKMAGFLTSVVPFEIINQSADNNELSKLLFVIGDFERISDHCSNIALRVVECTNHRMDTHRYMKELKQKSETFNSLYNHFAEKYSVSTT